MHGGIVHNHFQVCAFSDYETMIHSYLKHIFDCNLSISFFESLKLRALSKYREVVSCWASLYFWFSMMMYVDQRSAFRSIRNKNYAKVVGTSIQESGAEAQISSDQEKEIRYRWSESSSRCNNSILIRTKMIYWSSQLRLWTILWAPKGS